MNSNLFKAILAMDSYNRGYGEGIILPVILNTTKIGNATIVSQSDTTATGQPVKDGFYGIAYQWNSEKVISYRGTDNQNILTGDPATGWGLGGGDTSNVQGTMAIKFYQAVAGTEANWRTANISLTGHSLGGGLAGYVGALYNKNAALYDSMTFEKAAGLAYTKSSLGIDPSLKNLIYGTMNINDIPKTDLVGISGTYIDGEALGIMLPLRSGVSELNKLDLGNNVDLPDNIVVPLDEAIALHSMATLTIRMYADVAGFGSTPLPTDWRNAAKYFWPVMYDGKFAKDIGMSSVGGKLLTDALADPAGKISNYSDILRQIIAYSAIDEGATVDVNGNPTNARPFGDTAIRAFYNDANDLGKVLNLVNGSTYLFSKAALISESFIQYAGQLALSKILSSNNQDALNGILKYSFVPSLSNSNVLDYNFLEIDFSDAKWKAINSGVLPSMIARADLIGSILTDIGGGDSTFVRSKMQELWGDNTTNIFEKVVFVASDASASNSSAPSLSSIKSTLFITSDALSGYSNLIGTHGNDLFYGSGGNNNFRGSKGKDIYFGGLGIDNMYGYVGANDNFYQIKSKVA